MAQKTKQKKRNSKQRKSKALLQPLDTGEKKSRKQSDETSF